MDIILRAAVAYIVLLLTVRLIGRRLASMLAPFDLVVLFLIGGASLSAVLGDDRSLMGAFSAIGTIGLMHVLVSWGKARSVWFGRVVDGTPVVVFERGRWHEGRMAMLRLQPADVMSAVRQRGLQRLDQVRYAIVERDGKISIVEALPNGNP
jgi:uncharacterized membrane protein YcaP (DUF421 family)